MDDNIEKFKQEYNSIWVSDEPKFLDVKTNYKLIILEYLQPKCMQISIIKENEYATISNLNIPESIDILRDLHKEYKSLLLYVGWYYNPIKEELARAQVYYRMDTVTREEIRHMNAYRMTLIGLYSWMRRLEYNENLLKEIN